MEASHYIRGGLFAQAKLGAMKDELLTLRV